MDDAFKIYVEQLRDGHTEKISEVFSADFMEISEKDLAFKKDISVEGEAYLAQDNLILHLDITAYGILPCSICNEPVEVKIEIKGFYHTEPLSGIKSGIYNFQDILRETILLDMPGFAECNQGNCPARAELKKYLKSSKPAKKSGPENDGYQPFADLNLDKLKPKK